METAQEDADRASHGEQQAPSSPEAEVKAGLDEVGLDGFVAESASEAGPEPADAALEPADAAPRRRRVGILLTVAAVVYALDVISKLLVVAKLTPDQPVHVLGSFLQLTYTRNSGAAFSIGWGYTAVFSLIAMGVVLVILRLARRLYSAPWALALGLLLGGAIGNLTDRIARAPGLFRGWVVDFIQFPHFAIFNVADAAISCGGALMVLLAFRGLHPDGTDERHARPSSEGDSE